MSLLQFNAEENIHRSQAWLQRFRKVFFFFFYKGSKVFKRTFLSAQIHFYLLHRVSDHINVDKVVLHKTIIFLLRTNDYMVDHFLEIIQCFTFALITYFLWWNFPGKPGCLSLFEDSDQNNELSWSIFVL